MKQTEHTAIVLRCANYRDNDRMLTLFSPTRGKIEALARGCRRPKSPLLAASQPFALGDYELYHKADRFTVTGITLTETFYPLRTDFERLSAGTYLLGLCESIIQPNEPNQQLFMLLLHTLARLTFSDQPWKPLLAGFFLHTSAIEGYQPELEYCVRCGKLCTPQDALHFDLRDGGLCCPACYEAYRQAETALQRPPLPGQSVRELLPPLAQQQATWMRTALQSPASAWLDTPEAYAPASVLRSYVEMRLEQPVKAGKMLFGS